MQFQSDRSYCSHLFCPGLTARVISQNWRSAYSPSTHTPPAPSAWNPLPGWCLSSSLAWFESLCIPVPPNAPASSPDTLCLELHTLVSWDCVSSPICVISPIHAFTTLFPPAVIPVVSPHCHRIASWFTVWTQEPHHLVQTPALPLTHCMTQLFKLYSECWSNYLYASIIPTTT